MPTDLLTLTPFATVMGTGGTRMNAVSVSTSHGVDNPIGIATIEVAKPIPAGFDINSTIMVTAGYEQGSQAVIFIGNIAEIDHEYGDDSTVTFRCEGWARKLRNPQENEVALNYLNPYKLSDVFRYFCDLRDVPTYLVDEMLYYLYPAGTYWYIRIAGNSFSGPDTNRIPPRTPILNWMAQKARLFGYRVYDTPSGMFRCSRISGLPTGTPVATFIEGENIFSVNRNISISDKVNFWTVEGARFTTSAGVVVQIRSVPASVPFDPDLNPPGYRADIIRDNWIVNDDNALGARAIAEIDRSARTVTDQWETWGNPYIQPGQVISIQSPSTNPNYATDNLKWVMNVNHTITNSGFFTTINGWSGAGQVLPTADDCTTVSIGGGSTYHVGDQTRNNFRVPAPNGTTVFFTITVPSTPGSVPYTSMYIRGLIHGSNHGAVTSPNDPPRDLSRVEVWQSGVKVSSVDLPTYFDSLTLSYADGVTNWETLTVPLPGSLVPGTAEVRFVAGDDVDLDLNHFFDDYEVRSLTLTTCGIGYPALP